MDGLPHGDTTLSRRAIYELLITMSCAAILGCQGPKEATGRPSPRQFAPASSSIPIRAFVANADAFGPPIISPDGARLATVEAGLSASLYVRDLRSGHETRVAKDIDSILTPLVWSLDSRYLGFVARREGGVAVQVASLNDGFSSVSSVFSAPEIIAFSHDPNAIGALLVVVMDAQNGKLVSRSIDLASGAVVAEPAEYSGSCITRKHKSVCTESRENGGYDLVLRAAHGRRTLLSNCIHRDLTEVIGFGQDDMSVLVRTNCGRNTVTLEQIDLSSGQSKTVFSRSPLDLDRVHFSQVGQVVELVYTADPCIHVTGLTDRWRGLLAGFGLVDCEYVDVISSTGDEQTFVLRLIRKQSIDYVLHDFVTGKTTHLREDIGNRYAELLPQRRAEFFLARDGTSVPSVLTYPQEDLAERPVVVLAHGGPWEKSVVTSPALLDFAAFLANRGYAVIDVNYRGSSGFGRRHSELGMSRFAGGMADDLEDAFHHLVELGAAPRGVVVGQSFGGFLALTTLARPTSPFGCAVSFFGFFDVQRLLRDWPKQLGPGIHRLYQDFIGYDGLLDNQRNRDISPAFHSFPADRSALFLHGMRDPRITYQQSEDMAKILRNQGAKASVLLFPHEGHGFTAWSSNFVAYREVERFLAGCIGRQIAGSELLGIAAYTVSGVKKE